MLCWWKWRCSGYEGGCVRGVVGICMSGWIWRVEPILWWVGGLRGSERLGFLLG